MLEYEKSPAQKSAENSELLANHVNPHNNYG